MRHVPACVLALGLALAGAPAGAADGKAPKPAASRFDRLAKQAEQARTAGRLDEAVTAYGKALGLKPDWLEGHWALGTLLYDRDRFAEARDHFGRVAAAQPKDGVVLAFVALCDFRLGAYDRALTELQQARNLGIGNPDVLRIASFHAALLLNRAGNPDAAFEVLRNFAAKGDDNPAVLDALGLAMLRLPLLPQDIPADKREMVRLAGRGGYHMARGRRTAVGRLALEELVSRYPAEPNVHYAFAAYVQPEEPDLAYEEFRKELARDPRHVPALLQVAAVELRRGRGSEALQSAEEAARISPDVPAARLILGRALLEVGQAERAVQELEQGAALAPESAEMRFSLARAYQRAGRAEDAQRAREEFLRLDRAARERGSPADVQAPEGRTPEVPPGERGGRQP